MLIIEINRIFLNGLYNLSSSCMITNDIISAMQYLNWYIIVKHDMQTENASAYKTAN